jgi:uridine nucleosidase
MTRKIILDTDPGVDDALAFILALQSPELDVIGITTAFGNGSVQLSCLNALRILELCGRTDIPVAEGSPEPFGELPVSIGANVHGEDGLGNTHLAHPKTKLIEQNAVDFIIEMAHRYPGEITIVAVAPLANLAYALDKDPSIAHKIKEVVIMGGAVHRKGNITEFAEANFYNDPAAAERVLSAAWPITLLPLDATSKVIMDPTYIASLKHLKYGEFINAITPIYSDFYVKMYGLTGFHPHDPIAVAYLLKPEIFKLEKKPLKVITTADKRGHVEIRSDADKHLINICTDCDDAQFLSLFKRSLKQEVLEAVL